MTLLPREKTRTFNYIFRVYLRYIADTNIYNCLDKVRVSEKSKFYADINCFLGLTEENINPDDMYLYLTLDKSHPKFEEVIDNIKMSPMYIEHFSISLYSDDVAVKLKYPQEYRHIYERFIESKYSEMYKPNVSPISWERYLFKQEYTIRGTTMHSAYGILTHSKTYFNAKIRPLLTEPVSSVLLAEVMDTEYDIKFSPEKELINLEYVNL